MTPFRTVVLFCVLSLIDMVAIVGVLCYQVAFQQYFAWHLYPLMLNRAVELMSFICSTGLLPASYSLLQVPLSVTSIALYMTSQPYETASCVAPFAMYAVLISYQFFVALLLVKSRRDCVSERQNMERVRSVVAARRAELEASAAEQRRQEINKVRDVYVAVEMPNGEVNAMVARLCRAPPLEVPNSAGDIPPAHQEQPTPKPDPSMEAEIQPLGREGMLRSGEEVTGGRLVLDRVVSVLAREGGDESPVEGNRGENVANGQGLRREAALDGGSETPR
ncbi:hypothetical protein KFL_003150100 [Klebsormidium nitens]|uniref:Uncharacterized protein n=1 Tax=Klebsormidium nitens TaxID=105231 RepID=A0A1Y1I7B2_KLENI|nr:hypothetical protein KFL_003150100 [Klebsormidium nitens]|eukprot:GAQ86845.1 hypothetical protein KFL_003150100 [Klebsormidium nitens]